MGCYERESLSSALSPWLLDMNLPVSAVRPDSVDTSKELATSEQTSSSKRSAWPLPNPSPKDDTMQTVSKRRRRSRAKPKAPIAQLFASKLNFKEIVHQFTGSHNALSLSLGEPFSPCDKHMQPAGVADAADAVLMAKLTHSLKVLDTLCAHFFQDGSLTETVSKNLPAFRALAAQTQATTSHEAVDQSLLEGSHQML